MPEQYNRSNGPRQAPRLVVDNDRKEVVRNVGDPLFQSALRAWRHIAHRHGLVVASPVRLIGGERTFLGDSDEEAFGPKDFKLAKAGGMGLVEDGWEIEGVYLSKSERTILNGIGDILSNYSEFDIKDVRVPSGAHVDESPHEKGRWDIRVSKAQRVGTVVRLGDGSQKRYILSLWDGGFYRVDGQPPYDLPLFGLPKLRERDQAPVMVHEGPKAWQGAVAKSERPMGRLANWLGVFTHVGWHGSDVGMEWTDWSPLRGRKVVIWPDIDEVGVENARTLARRIALMGGVVEYVQWGRDDIEQAERWDWGDPINGFVRGLSRSDILRRIVRVESPIDAAGRLNADFLRRSAYDPERDEIYLESRDYSPLSLGNFCKPYAKGLATKIADSSIRPFSGLTYEPGRKFGPLSGGLLNTCRPNIREQIGPSPLDKKVAHELLSQWLVKMIPDRRQRMHLIYKVALAVVRPDLVSQHMAIMQGGSGIGKSVLLDLIVALAGEDRATSIFPDSVLKAFNNRIARKSVVCMHEIHASDATQKQTVARLKEIIANSTIEIEGKGRDRVSFKNVINWFGATNEDRPFPIEHGNNRFYFITCVSPRSPAALRNRKRFFDKWVPIFKDQVFLDQLYAAARWLVERMSSDRITKITGRAPRQAIWGIMEQETLPPWQQFVASRLGEIYEDPKARDVCFLGGRIVNLARRDYRHVGENRIRQYMNSLGYGVLRDARGTPVRLTRRQEVVWCRLSEVDSLRRRWLRKDLPEPKTFSGEE